MPGDEGTKGSVLWWRLYSPSRGFHRRGSGLDVQRAPCGRSNGRKYANQRKRGRNTMAFQLLPFSGILFFASLHTFLFTFSRHFYQKISCAKHTDLIRESLASLGQDRIPAPTVISHQKRTSLCHPRFTWPSAVFIFLKKHLQQSELCLDIVLENLLFCY